MILHVVLLCFAQFRKTSGGGPEGDVCCFLCSLVLVSGIRGTTML